MKKIAAWACLVVYLNAAAHALLPWITDGVAHLFFWQEHLEQVHNGKVHSHHVGLEMAAQADHEHEGSTSGHLPAYSHDNLSVHDVPTSVLFPIFDASGETVLNACWSFDYQSISPAIFLPPPDLWAA